ncbi:hypothetical protein, partial [Mesorhizobium sp.]|uniref:hypothetical protein n=1 Tax=Mesorhizobium sp. TaxID=1871066 RepID=UPI0025BB7082
MDEPALDADVAPQDVAHAGGKHKQASRHIRLPDDRHTLPLWAGLHSAHPAGDEAYGLGQFGPHRRDEVVVEDAVMAGSRAVEHSPLAHVDDLVECRGRRGKTVEEADPAQLVDLVAGDFLDTEL